MGLDKIFGSWNEMPLVGDRDDIASLWHLLAAQNPDTPEQINNCGLSQRRGEITMLWDLYRRARPKVVVEIGVAQGGTFASWCKLASSDALIVGIDRDVNDCRPRTGEPVHPQIALNYLLRPTDQGGGMYALAKEGQKIFPISGWSYEDKVLSQLREVLGGRKIDFLFHDASHSKEMFAKDFQLYWPMIEDGGIFAAHDVMPSTHPDCDKSVEWQRIKREEDYSACYEFFSSRHDDSMGIGCLVK